jgi:hypothetical protein
MKKIIILWVVIFSASCSSPKFFTSGVNPSEIQEMIPIEPFSFITLIERGNRGNYNDSISKYSEMVIDEALESFRDDLRLSSDVIYTIDDQERRELEKEIDFLITSAERNKKKYSIEITPLVESLLDEYDQRFGLIILQDGFTRVKGNYGRQVAKAVGLGIMTGVLTGVYYDNSPIKASSTLHVVIVDNQEKNVAFYNKSVLQNKEPTEIANIIRQINYVFEKYFWGNRLKQ